VHAEVAAVSAVESVSDDQLSKFSVDIKIGDEISDSKLGAWVKLSCGDDSERDEIAGRGGLEDKEKEVFACASIKIAEGKDPENARDRLSSLITKVIAFITSQNRRADRVFGKLDFKYRINDGHVDVFVIVDQDSKYLSEFDQHVWLAFSGFFNPKVKQELSMSLCFAKDLNDIRDAGQRPPLEPLFEGINFKVNVEMWSALQDVVLRIMEASRPNPMLFAPLLSGGSFDLSFGSINDVPEEIRTQMRMMSPFPCAQDLFDSIMPAMRD